MQQKKGQAAMEFLMTYGRAIHAAIVAKGDLTFFLSFFPRKLTRKNPKIKIKIKSVYTILVRIVPVTVWFNALPCF